MLYFFLLFTFSFCFASNAKDETIRFSASDFESLNDISAHRFLDLNADLHLRRNGNGTREFESTVNVDALRVLDELGIRWRRVVNVDRQYAQQYFAQRARRKRSNPFDDAEGAPIHHDNEDVVNFMVGVREQCSAIARVMTIGKSALGDDLFVVRITDNPDADEHDEPEFKYVGNMHGDEVVGREMLLNLIRYLCTNYDSSADVRALVDSVDLWIMPTMNPDGYAKFRRSNGHNKDLNRNFPDQYSIPEFDINTRPPLLFTEDAARFEPETLAMMKWSLGRNFVLSANLHGGSVVSNYPYDGNKEHRSGVDCPTPDNELFKMLARTYANENPPMKNSREFPGGITNGVHWYALYGGMQDWNYLWTGDMELTIELSYRKWPDAGDLPGFWQDNKQSLLAYINLVRTTGVRGLTKRASDGEPIANAICSINSDYSKRDGHWFHSDQITGDYFRVLLPGAYRFECTADGYRPVVVDFEVPEKQTQQLKLDIEFVANK